MTTATAKKATTSTKAVEVPASLAAATDESNAVLALSAIGWPGRTANETLEAAKNLVASTGRMAGKAAEEKLAKAAAKAAGATGLAAHDRDRVASLFVDGKSIAQAAAEAAPTREGTARALVWFVAAIDAAEKAV
jgi:hypothetical protein